MEGYRKRSETRQMKKMKGMRNSLGRYEIKEMNTWTAEGCDEGFRVFCKNFDLRPVNSMIDKIE
jgi:hypothetical protein